MSTATDIAALKARCLALEKRVAKLEAVKPIDYSAQIAALQKEVADLKYIISPTPPPIPGGNISLSVSHTAIGGSVTITGSGFGATQGASTVTFGEPINPLGFAPCTKDAASYVSWSDTSIRVTVPSRSPGAAGYPGTYHNVRVYVGGEASDAADFYVDPVTVNPSAGVGTSMPDSTKTSEVREYTDTSVSPEKTWTTTTVYTSGHSLGNHVITGTHDVLFKDCTFDCTSDPLGNVAGVFCLGQELDGYGYIHSCRNVYNVTLVNCVILNHMGVGSNGDGVNLVKTWAGASDETNACNCHDYTFSDCSFGTPHSPAGAGQRMGIELNEADYVTSEYLTNCRISHCTFEPVGGEPISLNMRQNHDHLSGHLIDDCLIKGHDNYVANNPYYGAIEFSGQGLEVRDVDIWYGNGPVFNFEGEGTQYHSYLYLKNVHVDSTHIYQQEYDQINRGSRFFMMYSHSYSLWEDCTFDCGTSAQPRYNYGDSMWASNSYVTFTRCTMTGYVLAYIGGSGEPGIPSTAVNGFDADVNSPTNVLFSMA